MREAFVPQKFLTFFQQKYWHILDTNIWNLKETLMTSLVLNNRTQKTWCKVYTEVYTDYIYDQQLSRQMA